MKVTDVTTFVIENPPPAFGGQYFIVPWPEGVGGPLHLSMGSDPVR